MSLYLDALRAGAAASLRMRSAESSYHLLMRTFPELAYPEFNELYDRALFGILKEDELLRVWRQIDKELPRRTSNRRMFMKISGGAQQHCCSWSFLTLFRYAP